MPDLKSGRDYQTSKKQAASAPPDTKGPPKIPPKMGVGFSRPDQRAQERILPSAVSSDLRRTPGYSKGGLVKKVMAKPANKARKRG